MDSEKQPIEHSGSSDCSSALSPEEQVLVYRIARNFQHDPQKVVRLIRETVGVDRLQVAVDYLESVVK
jgi:hypothetical protein